MEREKGSFRDGAAFWARAQPVFLPGMVNFGMSFLPPRRQGGTIITMNFPTDNHEQAYYEALDYLYSFIDYSLTRNLRNAPEKFDLGRMEDLMAALGAPHRAYPVVHIAGTKGKGSVAAMIAAALQAAGYRVGLYTSPHLVDFAERIQVDGQPIPHGDLAAVVAQLKPHVERIPRLTTFELTTASAFLYFAQRKVDVAVVEVGLGGRLDATNVVLPEVSVITSISYDHTAILGHTLTAIAREKAGIIKPGVPVVLAPQVEEARETLLHVAQERHAPVVEVGRDYHFAPLARSLDGQTVLIWPDNDREGVEAFIQSGGVAEWEPVRLNIPLLGPHQVVNAATAYVALQVLRGRGFALDDQTLRAGMARTRWPARFEVLQRHPPVVIDGAHNPDAARQVRLTVDEYFPQWPVVLVFGASEDKDIKGMFAALLPRAREVILTQSVHPRAVDPDALLPLARRYGKPAQVVAAVPEALEVALRRAAGEAVVLVTGSLFVAAAARALWPEIRARQRALVA